jgi:MSHA biogenesis protein MshO
MRLIPKKPGVSLANQGGFTLIEMIVVMVITGILSGMIVLLIKGPVEGYVASARRSALTDIADTALSRLTRDLRMALPNSVRIAGTCDGTQNCYLEYLEMVAGGRYIDTGTSSCFSTASMVSGSAVSCLNIVGDFGAVSNVLANLAAASAVVSPASSIYSGVGIVTITASSVPDVSNPFAQLQFASSVFSPSPGNRFQIVKTPVTYVCSPIAGGAGGTLTRYWGYPIQTIQPTTAVVALSGSNHAFLATRVSNCSFHLGTLSLASGQSAVMVSIPVSVTDKGATEQVGETLELYGSARVSNQP